MTENPLDDLVEELEKQRRQAGVPSDDEVRFRNLYDESPIAIEIYDSDGQVRSVNPACLELFGIESIEQVRGFRLFDDPSMPDEAKERVRRGRTARYEVCFDFDVIRERKLYETRRRGKKWLDVLITPVHKAGLGYLVQILDVTERVEATESLRRERERLVNIVDGTRAGTWEWNVQTGALQVNERWAEMLGHRRQDLEPIDIETWRRLTHPEDLARAEALLLRHFEDSTVDYELEVRMRHRDGHWVWVHDRGALTSRTPDGEPLMMFGTHIDITARKELEAEQERLRGELFQAQKMDAIGTLAGGVAHDFNNILAGLMGGLALLELETGDTPERRADLEEMRGLMQRGADLAKQLLGFGRRGKYDARPLDLGAVVAKTCTLFGRTRRDITIVLDLAPDLAPVLMDHAQLEQTLLNLFLNAGQAMPEGGQLLVRAENTTLAAKQTEAQGAKPGPYVRLVVADTGVGMDAATQARIFEPFFTTKPSGQGSGLGLSSVYGIVKNHGGVIGVESEPGKGAAFTICLPATDQPLPETRTPIPTIRSGAETILVVDDEEAVLKLTARLLRAIGYEVFTASGGREAVEQVRQHGERIAIVILDLTMPEMSGAATFEAIRKLAPRLKILLASGYSEDGQARDLLSRGCNGFIQKPFDLATLSAKLQQVL